MDTRVLTEDEQYAISPAEIAAMQEATRRGDGLYAISQDGAMEKILSYEHRAPLDFRANAPIIHGPRRRENHSRPRERRYRRTRAGTSRDGPDPEPDLEGRRAHSRLQRELSAWTGARV